MKSKYCVKTVYGNEFMFINRWQYRKPREKGTARMKRNGATSEEQAKQNEMKAIENLKYKISANFCRGDLFVTLTYKEQPTPKQARTDIAKFNRKMREESKKLNTEYKYILVAERGENSENIHFHLLVKIFGGCVALIKRLWGGSGCADIQYIGNMKKYGINNNYPEALAECLTKQTKDDFRSGAALFSNRYSCSQNLVEPIIRTEVIYDDLPFSEEPEQIKGYTLLKDSVKIIVDEYGNKSMKCTYIKQEKVHIKRSPAKSKSRQKNARKRCRKHK